MNVFALMLMLADGLTATKLADAQWLPSEGLPKGVVVSVVYGNPQTGPFMALIKVPAGVTIAPHRHSGEEAAVVVAGSCVIGQGDKVDARKGTELGPGSSYTLAARTPHWFIARTDCLVTRYSSRAVDIEYVNPKDDPRKK